MLAAERRQYILDTLRRDGKVVATDLSRQLELSEDTIRRDLRAMHDAGLLQRVHGGALPRSPVEMSYARRESRAVAAKHSIAMAAAGLLRDGQLIILDTGTTLTRVAENVPPQLRATIVTNSPLVMLALAEHPHVEIIGVGGRMFKDARALIGAEAIIAFRKLRADICIVSVASVHPDHGLGLLDYEEAQVKRTIIESSAEVVVVASADKLGTVSPFVVAPLHMVTTLVTEQSVPEETLRPYRRYGITILQA